MYIGGSSVIALDDTECVRRARKPNSERSQKKEAGSDTRLATHGATAPPSISEGEREHADSRRHTAHRSHRAHTRHSGTIVDADAGRKKEV